MKNWKVSTSLAELRQFLGFASYYRRFVFKFSSLAGPLHDLVTEVNKSAKNQRSVSITRHWESKHQEAFDALKNSLISAPVLGFADHSIPFILETDASHDGLGAVLSQVQDGKTKVIAYASRRLRPSEKSHALYSSMKLEFIAMKWAITEKFRGYLLGSKFTVLTDNSPLTYYKTAKLSAREQVWAAQLAQFDFDIRHRSGKTNPADALSRLPVDPESESTVVPDEVVQARDMTAVQTLQSSPVPFCEQIEEEDNAETESRPQQASTEQPEEEPPTQCPWGTDMFCQLSKSDLERLQQQDVDIGVVLAAMPNKPTVVNQPSLRVLVRQHDRLIVQDGLLYRKVKLCQGEPTFQLVLPSVLRPDVLRALHDGMGHQGNERTTQLLRSRVYWPGMYEDVKSYISACSRCAMGRQQRAKVPSGHLLASRPLEMLAMDFTKLEMSSDGRENVLVLTDA